MSLHLEKIIQALSRPEIYPHGPDAVRVVQTHISVVFIAGDLVYKVKKPLDLGFLDFTTLEKRKHFCLQEVILNSRFSQGIYLGVVKICEDSRGINLDNQGEEVEAAVLMTRVPEDRIMLDMLERDLITPDILDRIADRLARFHAVAATGPAIANYGSVEVIRRNLMENFEQTEAYIGRTIDAETHKRTSALALGFLEEHRDLFRERMSRGLIRDCHGDLHLDHVVILNGIMLLDCIEFNDRFRYGDTAADLAFLVMDLDYRGYPAFSRRLAMRYAQDSGDERLLELLGFYGSYRAFVRGKVNSFTLDEPEVSDHEKCAAAGKAADYFRLSLSYLTPPPPPVLVITCGLMGTGKSYLAASLGKRLGIESIRSDNVRKIIHGVSPSEHRLDNFGQGIYTPSATEQTYQALLDAADRSLVRGESVILDAAFTRARDRLKARDLAARHGARFRLILCTAPDEVIRDRLELRSRQENEPSDGRWEIFPAQKAAFEAIRDEEKPDVRLWDSTTELQAFLASFVRTIMFS